MPIPFVPSLLLFPSIQIQIIAFILVASDKVIASQELLFLSRVPESGLFVNLEVYSLYF